MEYRITDVYSSVLREPGPPAAGITYMECTADTALLGNTMEGSTSYYSFTIVRTGSLEVALSTGAISICSGDLFIYPPGVQFKVRNVSRNFTAVSIVAEEFFTEDIPQIRRIIRASYIPLLTGNGKCTHLSEAQTQIVCNRMNSIRQYIESESRYRTECLQMEYALTTGAIKSHGF